MPLYNKAYDRKKHGPINWFPVSVMIMLIINILILCGGTLLIYQDVEVNSETIQKYVDAEYQIVSIHSGGERFRVALLEDTDGGLYYVGFHRMERIDRYAMITNGAVSITDDEPIELKGAAQTVDFRMQSDGNVVFGGVSQWMNTVQLYISIAVLMFVAEFALALLFAHWKKRGKTTVD